MLRARFAESSAFAAEFKKVRCGVALGKRSSWRRQEVRSDRHCGMRISSRASFVPADAFKALQRVFPTDLKISTLHLRLPDNTVTEGFLVKCRSVPDEVPHYDVELFLENSRVHADFLMSADEQQRASQGTERFALACQHLQQTQLMSKISLLRDYGEITKAAKEFHANVAMAAESAADVGEIEEVAVQTRSTLEEEEGLMAAPPLKRGQRQGKGKSKNRSGGGRGSKGAGRGQAWRGNASGTSTSRTTAAAFGTRPSTVASTSAMSNASGRSNVSADSVSGCVLAMDAADAQDGDDEDAAFWKELQQVLAGHQLGRQFRRVS